MPSSDLIRQRLDRLESIPNRFINRVGAMQGELFAELLEVMAEFGVTGGELSASNLARINEMVSAYYERLRGGQYGGYVSWLVSEIENQKNISAKIFATDFAYTVSARAAAVNEAAKQSAVRVLLGDDFKTNFINVIEDTIVQNVDGGFDGLRRSLRGVFAPEELEPQMERWVKQVASDRFAFADRQFNDVAAEDLGLVFFQYEGPIIPTSREFCQEHAMKFYHKNEAQQWVEQQWSGKFRNTTPDNILIVLGGYNCQHTPVYVSVTDVPKAVIERNMANGNYVPSRGEREVLGLAEVTI